MKKMKKMKKDKKLTKNVKKVLTKIKKRSNIIYVRQRIRFINSKIDRKERGMFLWKTKI